MIFDVTPYIWVFILTAIPMALIYWVHRKQEVKKAKERISKAKAAFAKNRKSKKAQIVATGLVALAAVENKAALFPSEDNEWFDLFNDDYIQEHLDNVKEIMQHLEWQMSDAQMDKVFEEMEQLRHDSDIFGSDNMNAFSDLNEAFHSYDNDSFNSFDYDSFNSLNDSFNFDDSFSNCNSINNDDLSSFHNSFDDHNI